MLIDGAINGESFLAYVRQVLVPTLRPGDVVIMDNLGSHKGVAVREAIEAVNGGVRARSGFRPHDARSRAQLGAASRLQHRPRRPRAGARPDRGGGGRAGRDADVRLVSAQPGDVAATAEDVADLEATTGYRPGIDLEDGVRRFTDWWLGWRSRNAAA